MKSLQIKYAVAAALTFLSLSASADPLVFDRGLPVINLNNAAGANRSNVAWADGGTTVAMGDNFQLGANYLISDIRVWVVSREPVASNAFQLWLGDDTGNSTVVTPTATSTAATAVSYADATTYQTTGGDFIGLYQIDFGGLSLMKTPGNYAFGVSGPAGNLTPFLHASNAALSGSPQQGSDGFIYGFNGAGMMDVANGYPFASSNGAWDKNSDINVQVFAAQVPEPASIALLGLGLVGVGFMRRKQA